MNGCETWEEKKSAKVNLHFFKEQIFEQIFNSRSVIESSLLNHQLFSLPCLSMIIMLENRVSPILCVFYTYNKVLIFF